MRERELLVRETQRDMIEKYRMVGESEAFLDTMQRVSQIAKVNRPVLIIGERGTGKELVAARLHYLSMRWQMPRVTINCAAFSKDLLESEVFGHEAGAFTGAIKAKPGRFELADGGTLFLDELANSPLALQEKLLRVLEYGEFERVGGIKPQQVDVRVVAATNRDLPQLCKEGKFKEDLLDRLSFDVITLPPLRYRLEDIGVLTRKFALAMAREMGMTEPPIFTERARSQLLGHEWPGNVRELKNVIERAVFLCGGDPIDEVLLDPFESPYRPVQRAAKMSPSKETVAATEKAGENLTGIPKKPINLREWLADLEMKIVKNALNVSQYNQKQAAEHLGISYHQLRRLLKKYDLP